MGGIRTVEGEAHYDVLKTSRNPIPCFYVTGKKLHYCVQKASIDPLPELLISSLHFLDLFLYIIFDVILQYEPRASTRYHFVTYPDHSIIFFDLIASAVLV